MSTNKPSYSNITPAATVNRRPPIDINQSIITPMSAIPSLEELLLRSHSSGSARPSFSVPSSPLSMHTPTTPPADARTTTSLQPQDQTRQQQLLMILDEALEICMNIEEEYNETTSSDNNNTSHHQMRQ